MKREVGDKSFPIWLLGDSEPDNWKKLLDTPFDPRHPIRHNIWTSVLDLIQQNLYTNHNKKRLDSDKIFIRNAVENPTFKPPRNLKNWQAFNQLRDEINKYKNLILSHKPKIILSFGAFSFEFGRRCLQLTPEQSIQYWGAKRLGTEFSERIEQQDYTILIPLLHRSIAGGHFPNSHRYFLGHSKTDPVPNYFQYVADRLTTQIIRIPDIYLI